MTLPTDYKARKEFPLMTFLSAYFPDGIEALVDLSIQGNVQHEITAPKNQPFYLDGDRIAWDRDKSTEELETMMRHLWDHVRAKRGHGSFYDTDGKLHIVKAFWRAGAESQKTIESLRAAPDAAAVRAEASGTGPVAPAPAPEVSFDPLLVGYQADGKV